MAANYGMQIKLLREGWVNLKSRMAIISLEDIFGVIHEVSFTTERRSFRGVPFSTPNDILRTEI